MKKKTVILVAIICLFAIYVWLGRDNPAQYRCEIDSDCEAEVIQKNCCTDLRCVNTDFNQDSHAAGLWCRFTTLGLRGCAAGWMDITHCLCVNRTCVSMQGELVLDN